jgi:fructosamine-3-kinase
VEAALGTTVVGARPLGGGSIHHALRVDTTAGPVFVKWNRGPAGRGFGCEARSLAALERALGAAAGVRVPGVLGFDESGDPGWLALELLPPSPAPADYGVRLGRGLAALHRSSGPRWGWDEDNWIGSLPQPNPPSDSWPAFWRDARLGPQLARARAEGHLIGASGRDLDRVLDRVEVALAPVAAERPSLLHGDLWGGNAHAGPDGRPVLVDPASYHGHREVDLAMSELFGGFPAELLPAYREAWPLADGYPTVRRPLYQLYYLLVHVNLFGAGYVEGTLRAARGVLAQV